MGMNQEIYQELQKYLDECGIVEEVEDLLLFAAEGLEEQEILKDQISCQFKSGETNVSVLGYCELDEDDLMLVYICQLTINGRVFAINDYIM